MANPINKFPLNVVYLGQRWVKLIDISTKIELIISYNHIA
jgi:hypothetical protein